MPGFLATNPTTAIVAQHQADLLEAARQHRLARQVARPTRPAHLPRLRRLWTRPGVRAVQPC
jgi:hypothetical protein